MKFKSIVAAAAIALVAGIGSVSAGEMLTLSAIPAEPLTATEMEQVRGTWTVPSVAGGFLPGAINGSGVDRHPNISPPGRS